MVNKRRTAFFLFAVAAFVFLGASAPALANDSDDFPKWTKDVGSRGALKSRRIVEVNAPGDGVTNSTRPTITRVISAGVEMFNGR